MSVHDVARENWFAEQARSEHAPPCTATVVAVRSPDAIEIECDRCGVVEARVLSHLAGCVSDAERAVGAKVFVMFEDGDCEKPVIVGFLSAADGAREDTALSVRADAPIRVSADGKNMVIEGKERVEIRCGRSCIVLRRDGKVIIRGEHILSRATGANRIKGGHVDIN